eukprot:TRINITY_DN55997_c0_g1_i1.p1 TRINITY_DN55997_c0_g1~~TRINITY_DN55997_c0_g1_i1.p1  ORF type:complete len:835 (-),score=94.29 TRINITY_DN55997_c0_g1_i1:360-2732(-)
MSLPSLVEKLHARIVVVSAPEWMPSPGCEGSPDKEVHVTPILEQLLNYTLHDGGRVLSACDLSAASSKEDCSAVAPDKDMCAADWADREKIAQTQWCRHWMSRSRAALTSALILSEKSEQMIIGKQCARWRAVIMVSIVPGGPKTQTEFSLLPRVRSSVLFDLRTKSIPAFGQPAVPWLHFSHVYDFVKALQGYGTVSLADMGNCGRIPASWTDGMLTPDSDMLSHVPGDNRDDRYHFLMTERQISSGQAMFNAIMSFSSEHVANLLRENADPDMVVVEKDGIRALHLAVSVGNVSAVELLLKANCNRGLPDILGMSCRFYAEDVKRWPQRTLEMQTKKAAVINKISTLLELQPIANDLSGLPETCLTPIGEQVSPDIQLDDLVNLLLTYSAASPKLKGELIVQNVVSSANSLDAASMCTEYGQDGQPPTGQCTLPELLKRLRARIAVVSTPECMSTLGCDALPFNEVLVMPILEQVERYTFGNDNQVVVACDFAGSSLSKQECETAEPDKDMSIEDWADNAKVAKTQWCRHFSGCVRATLTSLLLAAEPTDDIAIDDIDYHGNRVVFMVSIGPGGPPTKTEFALLPHLQRSVLAHLGSRNIPGFLQPSIHWLHFPCVDQFLQALQGYGTINLNDVECCRRMSLPGSWRPGCKKHTSPDLLDCVPGETLTARREHLMTEGQRASNPGSVLAKAIGSDSPALVAKLLQERADPNEVASAAGGIPVLHLAVSLGNTRAVELLLAAGADKYAVDRYGRIPLQHIDNLTELPDTTHEMANTKSATMATLIDLLC